LGTNINPVSGVPSLLIILNNVVLPVPFLPTQPTLCPFGMLAEALSNNILPSILKLPF
jgi:hypothetical protein